MENVVIENYEYIFGPNSFYLPKKLIKTGDGTGTIPDGFAIDLENKKWFIVEAKLLKHSVWSHIAPQVSKQIIASQQADSKKTIALLAIEAIKKSPEDFFMRRYVVILVLIAAALLTTVAYHLFKPDWVIFRKGAGNTLIGPGSIPWEIGNAFSAMFKQNRLTLDEARKRKIEPISSPTGKAAAFFMFTLFS